MFLREPPSEDPLALAMAAYSDERWPLAKGLFEEHLRGHPDDFDALSHYAEALFRVRARRPAVVRATAEAHFRLAVLAPDDDGLRERALGFCRDHELWEALELYTRLLLTDHPEDAALLCYRALALARVGRIREAIGLCRSLIDGQDTPRDTYAVLAWTLHQHGLAEQALATFDQAEQRFPGDGAVRVQRACFLLKAKRPQEAREVLTATFEQEPGPAWPEALVAAAQVSNALGDWDSGIAYGRQALAALPLDASAHQALARALERNGETLEALEVLDSAPEALLLDAPDLLLALAELQITALRFDEVRATFDLYRRAHPKQFLRFDYLVARELLAQGHAADAVAKMTTVVESAPDFDRALYYLAIAHLATGERKHARPALDVYRRDHPGDMRARLLWEAAFAPPRTPAEAETHARMLLGTGESAAESLVAAAQTLLALGRVPDCEEVGLVQELLETALRRAPSSTAQEALVEFFALQGDAASLETARQALVRAEEMGLPENRRAIPRAAIALAEGDSGAAWSAFTENLAGGVPTHDSVHRWAELFAAHGRLDEGIRAIEEGAESARGPARRELEADRAALATRFGDTARALELIRAMEPEAADSQQALERLNSEKLAVARMLIEPGPGQDLRGARELIEEVAALEPRNVEPSVLKARLLLLQDPPDYAGAEAVCNRALQHEPSNANALALLAEILEDEGRPVPQPKQLSTPSPD